MTESIYYAPVTLLPWVGAADSLAYRRYGSNLQASNAATVVAHRRTPIGLALITFLLTALFSQFSPILAEALAALVAVRYELQLAPRLCFGGCLLRRIAVEYVSCEQIQDWVNQITHDQYFKPFGRDAFYLHVATCNLCRGAVVALSLITPMLFPLYIRIACADSHSDLAAFVDTAKLGPGSEVAMFPALWWHLLSCRDCADEYIDLRAFARTMPTSAATPIQVAAQARRSTMIARFALPRDFLQVALSSLHPQRAIVYRGGPAETHLLAREDVAPGFQATLAVQQDSGEHWSIVVTIIPPRAGQVQLKLGELERQAEFDAAGRVRLGLIPTEVLLAVEGPAMEVIIHGHEAS